jgi:hypothetical protein
VRRVSHVSQVVFTFRTHRDDDLAAAALAARAVAAEVGAALPTVHDSPAFEAPHVHRMLERVAADPARFVQGGPVGARGVWAEPCSAFASSSGELRRPADSLWYLAELVRQLAARDRSGSREALLIVNPEADNTDVYVIEVENGETTVTDHRFPFWF